MSSPKKKKKGDIYGKSIIKCQVNKIGNKKGTLIITQQANMTKKISFFLYSPKP